MKISVETIKYSGSIERDELLPNCSVNRHEVCSMIKNNNEIISCTLDDQGFFLWIEIDATSELSIEQIKNLIKQAMHKYLKP